MHFSMFLLNSDINFRYFWWFFNSFSEHLYIFFMVFGNFLGFLGVILEAGFVGIQGFCRNFGPN